MRLKIFVVVVFILLLGGCEASNYEPIEKEEELEYSFAVYNAISDDNSIENQRLLFSNEDIRLFEWDNQRVYFNDNMVLPDSLEGRFKKPNVGSEIFCTGNLDRFLVVVNDELIYDGYYVQSFASSYLPMGMTMNDEIDGVTFAFEGIIGGEDSRFDQRIYEAIKMLGLLEE